VTLDCAFPQLNNDAIPAFPSLVVILPIVPLCIFCSKTRQQDRWLYIAAVETALLCPSLPSCGSAWEQGMFFQIVNANFFLELS